MSDHPFPAPPPQAVRSCYRHPNQPAGVVCQRCDRPICPQCMHAASVGFHCPECVKQGGQKVYQGPAAFQNRPLLTQILIAVNITVFVLGVALSKGRAATDLAGRFEADGALFGPLVPSEPWRLVTSGFLHAGIIHIAFNMYALWVLGRILEPAIGRLRFGLVYGASMLTGALGVVLLSPTDVTVGASGAIFGLMGATLVVARRRGASQLVNSLLITMGLNLVLTISIPGISIGGHLGGVLGGVACGFVLLESEQRRSKEAGIAGVVAIGVGCAVIAFALMQSKYGSLG